MVDDGQGLGLAQQGEAPPAYELLREAYRVLPETAELELVA
jgi:hypothetical protein